MSSSPSVLITAASGNIGKPLVRTYLEKSPSTKLVLPTSNATRLLSVLPRSASDNPNVVVAEGDVTDPVWLEQLVREHSVGRVFVNLTGIEELVATLNTFDALRRAGCVQHVVYLSAAGDYSAQAVLDGALKSIDAGHVAVKFLLEQKLSHGGLPYTWTVLGPTLFFTNDLRSKRNLVQKDAPVSFFDAPLPIERGVSRVDPDDIGLAAFNALQDGGARWAGKKVVIGSRHLFTSAETGQMWSEALGRNVVMAGNDAAYLAKFEKHFAAWKGGSMLWGRDHSLMYLTFYDYDFYVQSDQEYKDQCDLLGKEPNSYPDFIKRIGAGWRKELEQN